MDSDDGDSLLGGPARKRRRGGGAGSGSGGLDNSRLDSDEFMATEEVMGLPCRAPNDAEPYPIEEEDVDEPPGFPALFDVDTDVESLTDLGQMELYNGVKRLKTLIDENLGRGMSLRDLVNLVHEFYTREIRAACQQAPEWSKRSIAKYIMHYCGSIASERQAVDTLDAVYATICLLRNHVGNKNEKTGRVSVNVDNVKLLLSAAKTHSTLVDARLKREKK